MDEKNEILKLYEGYVDGNVPTNRKYKEISNRFVNRIENFRNKLNKKDKKELDRIMDLVFEMNGETEKQMFIYAYSLGVRLTTEALYEIKGR